jgi:hypothetical protein
MSKLRIGLSLLSLAAACGMLLACNSTELSCGCTDDDAGTWVPLFNGKNLDGFTTFLERTGKNKDDKGIFKVENGMIHVMDVPETTERQETGYLATTKTYGNFHLRVQYKWGTKKFAPRATLPRDSGVHYLLTADDKLWGNALECQIQEGETGDLYTLNNYYSVQALVKDPAARSKTFDANGTLGTVTGGRLIRGVTADSPTDWNTVEVIVRGNTATHLVNGKVTMQLQNITREGKPVTEGRIALQAEAAEMWYRNIEIQKPQ